MCAKQEAMTPGEAEYFARLRGQRRDHGRERMDRAESELCEAARLAASAGLTLRQCSSTHYQLIGPGRSWILNAWPTTQRLYNDRNQEEEPAFLKPHLPHPWGLLDLVGAVIEVQQTGG